LLDAVGEATDRLTSAVETLNASAILVTPIVQPGARVSLWCVFLSTFARNRMSVLKFGELFRYSKTFSPSVPSVDGLPSFAYATRNAHESGKRVLLERGINPISSVRMRDGILQRPAILIRSSTHRIGSNVTPWHDIFDPDQGRILYFGDNKQPGTNPALSPGNRALLEEFLRYTSPQVAERALATPLVFFQGTPYAGRVKGHVRFMGFGLIRSVNLISQYHAKRNYAFSNYSFDCVVFSMAEEGETFDWTWINARRDPTSNSRAILKAAPSTWRRWVQGGLPALAQCQRRVAKLLVANKATQQPAMGSRERRALDEIYGFYEGGKHRFEALAAEVVAHIIRSTGGGQYRSGWITVRAGDGGTDFVGRLDLGSDFSITKIVVLGQAKCEKPDVPTHGRDIARTIARLRRGWIGAYVTTSFFSRSVQQEVIEDQYPVLLVHGLRLATEALYLAHDSGFTNLGAYLQSLDASYQSRIRDRQPEEILSD